MRRCIAEHKASFWDLFTYERTTTLTQFISLIWYFTIHEHVYEALSLLVFIQYISVRCSEKIFKYWKIRKIITIMAKKIEELSQRKLAIRKCASSIYHHFNCKSSKCSQISCKKVEKVNQHSAACNKRKTCGICRQYIALLNYHSKICRDVSCPVPNCLALRGLRHER